MGGEEDDGTSGNLVKLLDKYGPFSLKAPHNVEIMDDGAADAGAEAARRRQ
jgi:hypothetical protein